MTIKPAKRSKRRREAVPDDVLDALSDVDLTVGRFHSPEELDASISEFKTSLQIDKHALDEALQEQPDLFFRVSQVHALQMSRRDAAKQYLITQEAMVDDQLRRTGLKSQDKKTEKQIEAQKRINGHVVKAQDQLLRMEHSVRQWSNMKEAVLQRGHALREMVNLYVNSYYTTGSVTVGNRRVRDRDGEAAMDSVRQHYKKKAGR